MSDFPNANITFSKISEHSNGTWDCRCGRLRGCGEYRCSICGWDRSKNRYVPYEEIERESREEREREEFLEKESKRLLLEDLSSLEHEQWVAWSKSISKSEKLSSERLCRWKKLWIPYSKLSEEDKEHDRKWAKKVIKLRGGSDV